MSKLIVEVCRVDSITSHENAEKLEILHIKGWDVVATIGSAKEGELVIFIPPDSVLPSVLHEHLGITKYCAEMPKFPDGSRPSERRVKAARLRGVASYGTIMTIESFHEYIDFYGLAEGHDYAWNANEGYDASHILNITKWEPPVKTIQGDAERDHAFFHKYTAIENWKNYPDVFSFGDIVLVTEKIHGRNVRLGFMQSNTYDKDQSYVYMAGSHNVRKKAPEDNDYSKGSIDWMPYVWVPNLKKMLYELWEEHQKPIIVFGEIYGSGVQDMTYDCPEGKGFRAFDISIGGEYMDYQKINVFKRYDIPYVPVLASIPYDPEKLKALTDGKTTLGSQGKFKGREGIVITSATESIDPIIGRKILKSVSADYLDRKNGVDNAQDS